MKFVLPSHCSETRFPYKNLVIAQAGATPFIIVNFRLFFRIMVVEKAFHVAMYVCNKIVFMHCLQPPQCSMLYLLICDKQFITKVSRAVKS